MKELPNEGPERTAVGTDVPAPVAAPPDEGADPDQYLWGV